MVCRPRAALHNVGPLGLTMFSPRELLVIGEPWTTQHVDTVDSIAGSFVLHGKVHLLAGLKSLVGYAHVQLRTQDGTWGGVDEWDP